MSDENCLPHRENLAAYALGALDADELPGLEAHLANCRDCQSELAEHRSVAASLLLAVPPQTPPPGLRGKLIARLPSHQTRTPNLFASLFSRFTLWPVTLGAVMMFLLGLNLFSFLQIRELQQVQIELTERLSQDQTAIAMLAYPSTQALPVETEVEGIAGSMLVERDKRIAVLVLWNLPAVEPSQTYQVWLIDSGGQRVSGGLFRPIAERGYTTATIRAPRPLGEFVGVGVTVEPEGGSEAPTSARVLGVDF